MPKHNHKVTADFNGESRTVKGTVVQTLRKNPNAEVISINSSRFSGNMDYDAIATISGEIDSEEGYVNLINNIGCLLEDNSGAVILDSEPYIILENVSPLAQFFNAIRRIGETAPRHKETHGRPTSEKR